MKALGLKWLNLNYEFPATSEPQWKDLVQRWYQLDAYAYGLSQGVSVWQQSLQVPYFLILASPGASNETDKTFVEKGALSPAHFAHTLPNIRCSPVCQVMNWSGPVLCIQRDPESVIQGLKEGFELVGDKYPVIWILSVLKHNSQYQAHCFQVSESRCDYHLQKTNTPQTIKSVTDIELFKFIEKGPNQASSFAFGAYELSHQRK